MKIRSAADISFIVILVLMSTATKSLMVTGGENSQTAEETVVIYPAPPGIEAAPDYNVHVGDNQVFVYETPVAGIASFSFSGETEITIETGRNIEKAVIRPLSSGIEGEIRGNKLHFSIEEPANLSIEINDDVERPLFLFANGLEASPPDPRDPDVLYFKGGKVYEVGEIQLEDDMIVYIEGGAVVRGTIRGNGVRNAKISGRGILDAAERTYQTEMIELVDSKEIDLDGIIILGSFGWTVVPRRSRDISITNVKIVSWRNNDDGINVVGSRNVTIDGCFVRTKDDCIALKAIGDYRYFEPSDPDSGISTSDARPVGTRTGVDDVQNVQVLNSVLWNAEWGNAFEIGFELRTPRISDVLFKNSDIIRVQAGAVFSVNNGDYATVEDIRFEDIRIEDARDRFMDLRIGLSIYSEDCPWEFHRSNPDRRRSSGGQWIPVSAVQVEDHLPYRGRIRNIHFKDIQILSEELPESYLKGFGYGHNIENVIFENITHGDGRILNAEEAKITKENTNQILFWNKIKRKE